MNLTEEKLEDIFKDIDNNLQIEVRKNSLNFLPEKRIKTMSELSLVELKEKMLQAELADRYEDFSKSSSIYEEICKELFRRIEKFIKNFENI